MANEHIQHLDPYSPQSGTMIPGGLVKFLRTNILYQFLRFLIINIRMTKLILKSHH
jgi:hypothetical protein